LKLLVYYIYMFITKIIVLIIIITQQNFKNFLILIEEYIRLFFNPSKEHIIIFYSYL